MPKTTTKSAMKIFCLVFMLMQLSLASAQTISGTVVDENKQPLPGVSVYLDGTAIGTTSSEDGTFSLTSAQKINTALIVSMLGYETLHVAKPFDNPKYLFVMQPKAETLNTVVIQNDGFTRAEKLKAFLTEFLGNTRGGKSCTIHNMDDVNLLYNKTTNRLTASSDKPLRITNAYLGYEITFQLVEFYVDYNKRSLNSADAHLSFFAGTSSYVPMKSEKDRYEKHRLKSFNGSSMQFLRDLCRNDWSKDGFLLYRGKFPVAATDYFKIDSTDAGYNVQLLFPDLPNVTGIKLSNGEKPSVPKLPQSFNLLYDKRDISGARFQDESFGVDAFGNPDSPYHIVFWGEISKRRFGDLLPLDYEPGR